MGELDKRKDRVYVEQGIGLSDHVGSGVPQRIYESNLDEDRKRKKRRRMIEEEKEYGGSDVDMSTLVLFNKSMEDQGAKKVDRFSKRRTRGKGRKIKPKEI